MILSSFTRQAARSLARNSSSRTRQQLPTTTTSAIAIRSFVSRTLPLANDDDLPYHIVVGMPALSPTMEAGALAEWYVNEGDSFSAGDSLAKIETDKASIDFEAQDDGYVAKLLAEAGGGDDIVVGTPIMVTVEEEEDVGAFANFVPPETDAPAPAAKEEEEASAPPPPSQPPAPKEEAPPVAAAAAATPPPPPPPPAPAPATPPPAPAPTPAAPAATTTSGWGSLAFVNSPLVGTLSKKQKEYIEKYGTTGQIPL